MIYQIFINKKYIINCFVKSKDYPGTFTFDKIFDWNCTQKECFEYTALPIVGGNFIDIIKNFYIINTLIY